MEIVKKKVKDLTPDEYKKCSSLTLRESGEMQTNLSWYFREDERDSFVYLIKDEAKLLAWALVFPKYAKEVGAFFYVRKTYRRKGLGRALYKTVEKDFKNKFEIYPHDEVSENFFDKMEAE